ncbi:MAG: hypothetical protein AB7W16_20390 [Candidatus Obscuribacterales bacterium]
MTFSEVIDAMPTSCDSADDVIRVKEWWLLAKPLVEKVDPACARKYDSVFENLHFPQAGIHSKLDAIGIRDQQLPDHVLRNKRKEESEYARFRTTVALQLLHIKNDLRSLVRGN